MLFYFFLHLGIFLLFQIQIWPLRNFCFSISANFSSKLVNSSISLICSNNCRIIIIITCNRSCKLTSHLKNPAGIINFFTPLFYCNWRKLLPLRSTFLFKVFIDRILKNSCKISHKRLKVRSFTY